MDISVIVCTYNRSFFLPDCFTHLACQEGTANIAWEVVVVDNNSTDDTQVVLARLAAAHPGVPLRWVLETEQGLSAARNRGIIVTDSPYLVFIDDDILVAPGWLAAVYRAFVDNDADAVGGRIHLSPSVALPTWIKSDMWGFLGHRDFGDAPFWMDGRNRFPFGGNMAFHRRALAAVGPFDVRYGRKGEGFKASELFKGEETDYFQRLTARGGRIYYEPAALVYHQVQPHQLEKRYFRTIHYNAGYQKAYHDTTPYRRRFFGVPLFLFPQTARAAGRYLRLLLTEGSDRAFRQRMTLGHFLGMISGYAASARAG
jgi:glycosyltransferase involved in cell wall biosynthesis